MEWYLQALLLLLFCFWSSILLNFQRWKTYDIPSKQHKQDSVCLFRGSVCMFVCLYFTFLDCPSPSKRLMPHMTVKINSSIYSCTEKPTNSQYNWVNQFSFGELLPSISTHIYIYKYTTQLLAGWVSCDSPKLPQIKGKLDRSGLWKSSSCLRMPKLSKCSQIPLLAISSLALILQELENKKRSLRL